jgi:O-antigen ligase
MSISPLWLYVTKHRLSPWLSAAGLAAMLLAHPLWGGRDTAYWLLIALLALNGTVQIYRRRSAIPPWRLWLPASVTLAAFTASVLYNADSNQSLLVLLAALCSALAFPLSQIVLLWAGWSIAANPTSHQATATATATAPYPSIFFIAIAGAALSSTYALFQFSGLDPLPPATAFNDRIVSTFSNPNHFGNFAAAGLPVALGLCLKTQGRRRWAATAALSLIYSGLLVSACRGAWWAGIAGCLVYLMGGAWRQWRRLALLALLLAGITTGLMHRPALQGPDGPVSLGDRLASSRHIIGDQISQDSTINHRYFLWNRSWEMISDHPVLGIGYGNFQQKFPLYRDQASDGALFNSLRYHQKREETPYAHNEILHLWAETGIIGLLAALGLVGAGIASAIKRLSSSPNADPTWILLGLISVFLVHSQVSYPLRLAMNGTLFWLALGALFHTPKSFSSIYQRQ